MTLRSGAQPSDAPDFDIDTARLRLRPVWHTDVEKVSELFY